MATYTAKQLTAVTTLTASEVTQYTVPGATTTIVKQIIINNNSAVSVNVGISVVPSGGTATEANRIFGTVAVPAGDVITIDLSLVMPTGAFISAKASIGSDVNIHISGIEVT